MLETGSGLILSGCPRKVQLHSSFPMAHIEIRLASVDRIDMTSSCSPVGHSEKLLL